jgi:signal transduction histidine kinase/GAF domain-containing protein
MPWHHDCITSWRFARIESNMTSTNTTNRLARRMRLIWRSPRIKQLRYITATWRDLWYSGPIVLILSTLLATVFIIAFNRSIVTLVNPGLIYLPVIAMLAYHWKWLLALVACILQLFCVYFFFFTPINTFKPLDQSTSVQLIVLATAMGFVLAIVQLAAYGRNTAEHSAARFAALNRIGSALASELDEARLLHLIAETARDLTGAAFAAFTLRPVNEMGVPLVPSEGHLFHLAAVVGVRPEQEEMFRHTPLGGEGLLAPIFHHGIPVRVSDALAYMPQPASAQSGKFRPSTGYRNAARQAAFDYAHGHLAKEGLHSMGVPRGHPIVRSFLGAPLLDHSGDVRGGLLLGHSDPDRFSEEDETLLVGLATEAAIALENARLYSAAQTQARELDTIFESIADGIMLVDEEGHVVRENRTARRLREKIESAAEGASEQLHTARMLLQKSAVGTTEQGVQVAIADDHKDVREYLVNTAPLHPPSSPLPGASERDRAVIDTSRNPLSGAVVVWHDVTEAHRLLSEQQAHAETEARRVLLQTVINELPGSVYLVRGRDARLVLANRAATEVWGVSWEPDIPLGEFLAKNGIRVFHIDGRPLALEEFATLRAVQKGVSVHHHQEIIRHADGTTLPVLVNAVALDPRVLGENQGTNLEDREPAAIVVHLDVTSLKDAEHMKDEFIGIAAHELRTPMAVIRGFVQMLIMQTNRGKGPELADWQTEAIADIDSATGRLVELTEDLLDVTRLQAGRLELQLEPTDLVALVKRIAARFQVTTVNHRITINTSQEHLVCNVDPRRIEQVFSNLINNAIKYSPMAGDITITLDEDQQFALFSIQDHGIGIPERQHRRIFSRFMRADNTQMYDIKGTGLGLYLSRELVERHNGRIWFKSVEGEGSTFNVSLPLYEKSPPTARLDENNE